MKRNSSKSPSATVFTIGHSTRTIEDFITMLNAFRVESVADVRTVPKSRFNPQYNSDQLAASLRKENIEYRHIPELGGLRHPRQDSANMAWENASFRGFADYMQTEEFQRGLNLLTEKAEKKPTAIMCAEAVPWRCHRSLISDALTARGLLVKDIMSRTSARDHAMTPWAVIKGGTIIYPKRRLPAA